MRSRVIPVILAIPALLLGCGKDPVQVGGEYPAKVYTRIVSLSPSATEILSLLNQEPNLAGRTASCDSPETIRDRPIVANPEPNLEMILSLQPDLVVYDAKLFREDNPVLESLRKAGVEVRGLSIDSVEDWQDTIIDLGNLFMEQVASSREVDKLKAAMHKGKIEPQPRVMVAMGGARPMAAGINSFQANVVRVAGGQPVGPDADRFVPVNLEQVTQWNPDYVFVPGDTGEYYANPGWAATNAGRNGRILRTKENLLLRPGGRVADLISTMHDNMREDLARDPN